MSLKPDEEEQNNNDEEPQRDPPDKQQRCHITQNRKAPDYYRNY